MGCKVNYSQEISYKNFLCDLLITIKAMTV